MGQVITSEKYKQYYISPPLPCFKISRPERYLSTILYTDGYNFAYDIEDLNTSEYNISNRESLCLQYPPSGGSWKSSGTRGFKGCIDDLYNRVIKLDTYKECMNLPISIILLIEKYVENPIECETVEIAYIGGN